MGLRWRSLWRRDLVEQELDDELQFHVEKLTSEYIAEGRTSADARAAALRSLGGLASAKERCRDQRRLGWLEDFVIDTRVAIRVMRRRAGSTVVALLTLALGVG